MGRVSKSNRLFLSYLSIVNNTLVISMSGLKVSRQQDLQIYLHRISWVACPMQLHVTYKLKTVALRSVLSLHLSKVKRNM